MSKPAPTDPGDLVERARAMDGAAWETLYRDAYPRLFAYAARRLDADHARDAVAETMARAVAGIARFRMGSSGFNGWLFGILRHVVVDQQRVNARVQPQELPEMLDPLPDTLSTIVRYETAAEVRVAFAALTADDQELLELRVMAGLTSDEVAKVLGKRAGAVRMAQARALARLRDSLKEAV